MNPDLSEAHIAMVERVNTAPTEAEHHIRQRELSAWRRGAEEALGTDGAYLGRFIREADMHYLNQGIDRPMCGGVWLDWEPS